LITAAVLTRTLGPDGYGLFSVAATFITWLAFTSTTLLARAAVKLVSEAEDWQSVATSVLRWRFGIGALAFLFVLATAGPIARVLQAPALAPYLRVFAVDLLLFNLARAHRDVLTARGRFREVATVSVARWTARLILIVALVLMTGSVMAAVAGSVGATLVELLVARRLEPLSLRGPSSVERARMWHVAAPLMIYGAAMQLYSKIDLFALSALGGTTRDAGLYAAAQNLAVAPGLFALAIGPLLLATLSRLRRTGDEMEAKRVARAALRVAIALVPLAALVAGAADDIVRLIFGASFAASALLVTLLFAAAVALAIAAVAVAIITAADHQRVVSTLGLGILVFAIAGHLVLIPRLGAVGAAAVTAVAGAAGALAALALVHRMWDVHAYGTMARAALIAVPAYWLAVSIRTPGFVALALKLVALSLAIFVAFLALGELDAEERRRWRASRPRWRLSRVSSE
jgi:O-antigen/teichoic acid export membrane protein